MSRRESRGSRRSGPPRRSEPSRRRVRVSLLLGLGGLLVSLAACEPSISPGKAEPGQIGASCQTEADCALVSSPECLKMGQAGYCASDCAGLGQLVCPAGAVCEQLGDQALKCMDGCCGVDDCREGFRCERKPELEIYVDLAVCAEPGICFLRCTSDVACSQGQVCDTVSGRCVPRVGADSEVGAACASGDQCNSGTCLTAYPGGYCTSACGTQLSQCEPGSECFGWRDATATCMARCEADAACRAGYRCEVSAVEAGGSSVRGFCVPRCDAYGSCPDGQSCDPRAGACVEGAAAPGPIGAFCHGDADCAAGTCDVSWPNGYCTAGCGSCEAGAVCVDARCLRGCAGASDCRFQYVCVAGGCQPGCATDADCSGELLCNSASGLCVAPGGGGGVVDLAAESVQVTASGSPEVVFTVPSDGISAFIHASDGGQTLLTVWQLFGPDNTLLYDIQNPAISRLTFLPSEGTFSGMFPNGPGINLVPGSYSVSFVRESGTATAAVRVLGKTASGFPTQQTLPLVFTFVGAPAGLTAATAPTDSRFQQAVAEVETIYGALGVRVDAPVYEDLANPGALAVIDTVEGAGSELSQLLSRGTRDGVLHFYLVEEILGGADGYTILGIAGGIPGPPGIAPGPHAGVAVTLGPVLDQPVLLGQVIAHEGAHYLGLFHTTEATGTVHDPLPDTTRCEASQDANWDGYVSPEECAGHGADNFMFWAASGTARGTSPEQGRVVRRNPLTQ